MSYRLIQQQEDAIQSTIHILQNKNQLSWDFGLVFQLT